MGFFGKKEIKSPGLLGVDIGAGGIKVVEVVPEEGRMRLATYGYSQVTNPDTWKGSLLDDPKKSAEILSRIRKESGMKSTRANASLPSQHVFHAIITIPQPKDEKEDVKALIESQVKKLLPMPLENMILDSTILDKFDKKNEIASGAAPANPLVAATEPKQKHIRVLVSGASKELVQKYVTLFKMASLELVSLETEAFALIRSLIGKEKGRMMIVDIGFERTNITIVNEGIPYLHRSIKVGGGLMTQALAKQAGISLSEAEQMKVDLAFSRGSDIPQILKDAMMPILHEIRYSLELFSAQSFHEHQTVEKILLTGGSSHLPNIDPFLTESLNINVYLGDPWARLILPSGIRPLLEEIGPRFSVSAGLAMKLMPEKQEKKEAL